MDNVLAIGAIVSASVAVLTLACVIWSIRRLSEQTDLLRKQVFGEVYEEVQIRYLQFFLPAKANRPIAVFEEIQKEDEEVVLGQEVKISRRWETELHVQFWMDAPQRLSQLCWGFAGGEKGQPLILEYRDSFVMKSVRQFEREVYQDWHGYWHIEFPFPRFLPKDFCYVLAFTVKGETPGKFPLEFEISTNEGKDPFKHNLWVEITE